MIRSFLFLLVLGTSVQAAEMRMAVTTSFLNSGLADILLPAVQEDLGLTVHLLAVGTGQAIRLGQAGDVDAILVHSRAAEEAFVAQGYGTHRREIMFNDFVIVGPNDDPASLRSAGDIGGALRAIAASKAPFVSRGDDSGTHKKERSLWVAANITPEGAWYRPVGAGMGSALNTATAMQAYILADRASWLNYRKRGDMALLFAGDPALFNQYAYLPVNPVKHPHINVAEVAALEAWLTGPRAKQLINGYQIEGETLFTFNAAP